MEIEEQSISSFHLQQQELVSFLYRRLSSGIFITLFVSAIAGLLAYIELSIQGRGLWVIAWFGLLALVAMSRLYLGHLFFRKYQRDFMSYQKWSRRFFVGAIAMGAMLGSGAALLMPYVTINVQIILHSLLLGLSMGAIAYLSTSLRIYIGYLVSLILPVTLWLLSLQTLDGYILSFLYLFMVIAGSISVKRMNVLLNDALYYRFDNEILVEDLQHLLNSVSRSNKALEKIAVTDELTGVFNHRALRVELEEIWDQYRGRSTVISLLKVNIDYFHEYNACHGHRAGDQSLCEVARILTAEVSHSGQMVARLSGAEFAVLLPGIAGNDAYKLAGNIAEALESRKVEHGKSRVAAYLSLSIGIGSQKVSRQSSARELLVRVDTALKLAKERGRNRIEILQG